MENIIVFDMDGVLAEVSESYRESIVRTVESFTGQRVSRDVIQDYKNQGGWNNDWLLSQKIASDLGVEVDYKEVVDRFNEIFLGHDGDGLIERETWLPEPGLLERLAKRFGLAIFTGRMRYELDITLRRFADGLVFDPIVCADDVARDKPAPDGLLLIQRKAPGSKLTYVGDTVDDARAAAAASIPFIGVAAHSHSRRDEVIALFREQNAIAILENINEIEGVL